MTKKQKKLSDELKFTLNAINIVRNKIIESDKCSYEEKLARINGLHKLDVKSIKIAIKAQKKENS